MGRASELITAYRASLALPENGEVREQQRVNGVASATPHACGPVDFADSRAPAEITPSVLHLVDKTPDPETLATPANSLRAVDRVVIDFETFNRGGVDLRTAGAWCYANDPATDILTLALAVGGEQYLWTPGSGLCDPLRALSNDPAVTFVSHGSFDQIVWHCIMVGRYGFPAIPIERWHDTIAACAYHALPPALSRALTVTKLPVSKDLPGRRLVLSLSRRNRKTGEYPEITPEVRDRIAAYNHIDTEGAAAIDQMLGRLPDRERQVWELDQVINRRGIGIDREFVHASKRIADVEIGRAFDECVMTTGYKPTQVQKLREWLHAHGTDTEALRALDIERLLQTDLPHDVRRVLESRLLVAKNSLKKLDAALACIDANGCARGLLQYHAATPGRWAGRLLQPQNFPRPTIDVKKDDIETLVDAIKTGDPDALRRWGAPVDVLASALRHMVIARDGSVFGVGDFATVEARIVLALAGQNDKLDLIASGADVYRDLAADIFGLDKGAFLAIPKGDLTVAQAEQRQIGKNTALGAGFGLGATAFSDRYCNGDIILAKRIIDAYRNTWAPKVPRLWANLENAAAVAMKHPGRTITANCGVKYSLEEKGSVWFLVCTLLNGKRIHYPDAKYESITTPWGENKQAVTYMALKSHQWRKVVAHKGHLTENVVQAHARELLVDAMLRFESLGFPVVLTVHDEIVVEHPDITTETVMDVMQARPDWLPNLPVSVEAWVGKRYRK